MKKIISILSLLISLNFSLISQVTLSIPNQTLSNNTNQVSVPVIIKSDYPMEVIGWQFFLEWDENVLTFQSISDIGYTALKNQDFGTPIQTGKNHRLNLVWENYPETIFLTGESQLFMLHFQANTGANVSQTSIDFCTTCRHEMYKTDLNPVQLFYKNGHINIDGSLPLALLSFTARPKNNEVILLNWKIEEQNIRHFEIQRSEDGLDWTSIGQTYPQVSNTYQWTDKKPFKGLNLYRLKLSDTAGKFSYSNIQTAKITIDDIIFKYQNPIDDELQVQWSQSIAQTMVFKLYDTQGKLLKAKKEQFSQGSQQLIWNIGDLASGLYFLEIIGEQTHVSKIVKQ